MNHISDGVSQHRVVPQDGTKTHRTLFHLRFCGGKNANTMTNPRAALNAPTPIPKRHPYPALMVSTRKNYAAALITTLAVWIENRAKLLRAFYYIHLNAFRPKIRFHLNPHRAQNAQAE
jgi:hypothetical protein